MSGLMVRGLHIAAGEVLSKADRAWRCDQAGNFRGGHVDDQKIEHRCHLAARLVIASNAVPGPLEVSSSVFEIAVHRAPPSTHGSFDHDTLAGKAADRTVCSSFERMRLSLRGGADTTGGEGLRNCYYPL